MDHQTAADSNAAERYTLDEMSAEERDAFEEHYFDCGECAADVRATEKFADGVRTLPPIERVPSGTHNQRFKWLAAAAAIVAVALGVQTWMTPHAARPASQQAAIPLIRTVGGTADEQVLAAASRSNSPAFEGGKPIRLGVPIRSDLGTAPDIELRDANHTLATLRQLPVDHESYLIHLELNVPPGSYTIVARGNGAVTEYPITVRPR